MKIKFGLGITTLVVAGLSLSGCSGPTAPPVSKDGSVSGTVTGVFDVTFKEPVEKIVANFEKKYPGVNVDINYQGGDVGGLISTQIQAGTAPDVLLTFPGGAAGTGANVNVVTLASQGRLLSLSDSAWTKEIPKIWESDMSHKGEVYAYPGAAQPLAAVYNQSVLDKLGLKAPTTLDEVYTFCDDAKKAGVYAYAQGLGEAMAGPQMLSFAQTASLVYGPDPDFKKKLDEKSTTYTKSPWVEQFKIYKKMSDSGCFGEGALGRSRAQGGEAVASGQALGMVDVGAQLALLENLAPESKFVVAPIPATNGKNYVTALPGYTLAINAKAKNPAAAKAFLDFMAEPEQSAIYANGFSSVPILPNDQYTPQDQLKEFAALLEAGAVAKLPDLGPATMQATLNETVQSMLLGNDTPESAAEKMQKAFDAG